MTDSCVSVCQNVFDIPDVYFSHVSQHADLYPSGNKPDGGCACMWEGRWFHVDLCLAVLYIFGYFLLITVVMHVFVDQ